MSQGNLHGAQQISDWIHQRNDNLAPIGHAQGGFRLLVCERRHYRNLLFDLSRQTFLDVEKHFGLHAATLHSFRDLSGNCNWFRGDSQSGQVSKLSVVIKADQKFEVSNYGLSISHDLTTKITTGILYGQGLLQEYPPNKDNAFHLEAQLPSIRELLRGMSGCWEHPVMVPATLILHHSSRLKDYVSIRPDGLWKRLDQIQLRLGVTKVGSSSIVARKSLVKLPIDDARVEASRLTEELNTYLTEVFRLSRGGMWELDCVSMMRKIFGLKQLPVASQKARQEIEEVLDYLNCAGETLGAEIQSLKACAECQLDVVSDTVILRICSAEGSLAY